MSINLFVLGLATTISPLFVIAAVLMMSESQRVRTSWAAACGWLVSIAVSCLAIVLVGGVVHGSGGTHRSHRWFSALDLALGLAIGCFAAREFRRSRSHEPKALPKWANRVGTMSVVTAFGLGLFLPANVLAYAAGNEIVQQHVSGGEKWLAIVLYATIGSLLEFGPVLVLTARSASRDRLLALWHRWLNAHWQQVLVALFSMASLFLVVKGAVAFVRSN